MKSVAYQPWVHWYVVATAVAALSLPILMGALVTTTDAGMAFRDWPASDGQNMFFYPWLKAAGDKFLEHGHRLAGSLIGMLSIGLALLLWWKESRRWVQWLGAAVLAGVIVQGILGGQRVLLEDRGLAFVHGVFASWVFALMCSVALFTSRGWLEPGGSTVRNSTWSTAWKWIALGTSLLIAFQYLLGALVRHHGTAVFEHAGFALLVAAAAVSLAWCARRSGIQWLRRPAWLLLALLFVQIALGVFTYVVKFGFGSYVAQYGSTLQTTVRTAHVLVGMLVWMTSVILTLRVWRCEGLYGGQTQSPRPRELSSALTLPGGVR